jgi:hypothetical protein
MIAVTFFGTDKEFDFHIKRKIECTDLRVRGNVVLDWLKLPQADNTLYE